MLSVRSSTDLYHQNNGVESPFTTFAFIYRFRSASDTEGPATFQIGDEEESDNERSLRLGEEQEATGRFTVTPAGRRKRLHLEDDEERRTATSSSSSTSSSCDSLDNELVVAAELHEHDEM